MKIAIVRLSALGDIIHSLIVIEFLVKEFNNLILDFFTDKSFSNILTNNPHINNIYLVNLKLAKQKKSPLILIQELKKLRKYAKYDIVIDMQGLIKSAVVAKLIPSTITLGFDKYSIREKLASFFYNKTCNIDYNANIVLRNAALISTILKDKITKEDINNKKPALYGDNKQFNFISATDKNIVLILGASKKNKILPIKKYEILIKQIHANFIIIWGNNYELKLAKQLKHIAPHITIANKLTLSSLVSLIKQVNLVIGGDTGPTYIAWAVNVPSIVLFGVTPYYRNCYTTNTNKIISVYPNNIANINEKEIILTAINLLK